MTNLPRKLAPLGRKKADTPSDLKTEWDFYSKVADTTESHRK
jgi:hypothetical protein